MRSEHLNSPLPDCLPKHFPLEERTRLPRMRFLQELKLCKKKKERNPTKASKKTRLQAVSSHILPIDGGAMFAAGQVLDCALSGNFGSCKWAQPKIWTHRNPKQNPEQFALEQIDCAVRRRSNQKGARRVVVLQRRSLRNNSHLYSVGLSREWVALRLQTKEGNAILTVFGRSGVNRKAKNPRTLT